MFEKYRKIQRLGHEENEGILEGTCYVQEKIDGANTSVWLDNGILYCGSRNRQLGDEEFNGFVPFIRSYEGVAALLKDHPNYHLYGEWLCLSGDTIIKKVSAGKSNKGNYMTLKEMYQYSQLKTDGRLKSWWARYGMPQIYSLDPSRDKVLPNRIKQIVYSGQKEVFKITTREGFNIKATADHKFLTQDGYRAVKDFASNTVLAVSDLRSERTAIRNLGVGSHKMKLLRQAFVKEKGVCSKCPNATSLELDHIDEDWRNNNVNNWQVLCSHCHRVKSGLTQNKMRAHKKGYSYRFDKIISIQSVGTEDVYDVEMEGSEELANFVASNFIVHNCRHTVQYKETSYRQWYLFDILVDGGFLHTDEVYKLADKYKIPTPAMLNIVENPNMSDLEALVGLSVLGDKGEGVVIKNPLYRNKFGVHVYAKLVSQEFKERNAMVFGGNNKHSDTYWEMYICQKYMTLPRVQKVMNKIQPEVNIKLDKSYTPRISNTAWHDMITEEIWDISKKVGHVNFNDLKRLSTRKATQIYHDILDGTLSVADNPKI